MEFNIKLPTRWYITTLVPQGVQRIFYMGHPRDYDRSKAVVLLWFSGVCFGVRVSVTFHLMFVNINFSSVWERAAHSVDHMLSWYFDYFSYFPFWF